MSSSWKQKKFGECAELIRNTCLPDGLETTPYIGLEHIEEGTLRLLEVGTTADVISTKSRFESGDILFGKLRPYFRKVVRPRFSGVCSTDIWVVRSKQDVDQGYLFYWMASQEFVDAATQASEGTKMPRAKWDFLERIEKPVPPLPEQRAIAHILGTLDDKIELNNQMNQTLESMAQALFKGWFVDFEPFRDQGMQDSRLGEIPVGWKVTSLAELYLDDKECVITGPFGSTLHAHDYRDTGTPLILVKHVNSGHIDENDLPLVSDHKMHELLRYRLKPGDIVFTRVGAVGRSALVHPRQEGWLISGQMLRVRVRDEKVQPIYLAQLYLTRSFVDMVEAYALGTTRPSLNTSILEDFRFICPPPDIQREYVKNVLPFNLKVQQNLQESRTLSALREALLPKLLSGEIQIGDADRFLSVVK